VIILALAISPPYNVIMLFKKDELSKFDFISIKDFFLALFLMLLTIFLCFVVLPSLLKKYLPDLSSFIDSYYFGIFIFFLSSFLTFYIIYFFCCKSKQKSLVDGMFLYKRSKETYFISILIGIIMPLITLPIIFKYAPREFYAMDVIKTLEGKIYLFTCALSAPIIEEVFYRGFIFPFFQSKFNSFWAIVITALFFGISHFANIGNAHILIGLFIFYGSVLGLLRYITNSLIPPMITHYFQNLALIIGFLVISR